MLASSPALQAASRRPSAIAQHSCSRQQRAAGAVAQQHTRQQQHKQRDVRRWCAPPQAEVVDEDAVADLIAAQPLDEQQKAALEALTNSLGVPLGAAKAMVFKKRGLASLAPGEILDRVAQVADIVGVTTDRAIEMVTIQPGLLFDTQRNAEALALGIRAICYELNAPKDEVVTLILRNQSVLHGREMHLSVADIAHLAMLREPGGRVAE